MSRINPVALKLDEVVHHWVGPGFAFAYQKLKSAKKKLFSFPLNL